MRFQTGLLFLLTLSAPIFSGCDNEEEAELVVPETVDDNDGGGGNGGGGTGGGGGNLTLSTPCSVQMTVNGTAVSYTADGLTYTCGNGSSGGGVVGQGNTALKSFQGFISDDSGLNAPIGIELGSFEYPNGGPVPEATFFSFFHTGTWTYGDPETQVGQVRINMWENGIQYATNCAPGTQTGSAFEITELQEFPSDFTDDAIKFRVTFNCTLYPCDGGAVKTITNGTAVVGIGNI